jgi:uncharacterized protein YgbK (DUF1537 family)
MIAVIADDMTGAAEIGGVGIRYGLRTEVRMEVPEGKPVQGETAAGQTELLVIATDTRSMARDEAVEEMRRVTRAVMALGPAWVYKKTDSVLRGHVADELLAQMEVMGIGKALLAPANPGLGRTIKGGRYYINGVPIHETSFRDDPEYPVSSSEVRVMLGAPEEKIVVGEVETADDLRALAACVDEGTFPAGAAEFFAVMLGRKEVVREPAREQVDEMRRPILFVSGTAFRKVAGQDGGDIVRRLREEGKATVAGWPRESIAEQVRQVLSEVKVRELVIEGGATAYAVLRATGLTTFVPVEEMALGVVRMHAGDIYATIKPGSYTWPGKILTI